MKSFETRFAAFLIWGHGGGYRDEILSLISSSPRICVRWLGYKKLKSIKPLVKCAYKNDYAPIAQLGEKLKYLSSVPA